MTSSLPSDLQGKAEFLKAIAHPTRLAILEVLKDGPLCVQHVGELLGRAQPNISQHLSVLRQAHLITYTEQGKQRCYSLEDPVLIGQLLELLSHAPC
ncbi:MAG: winged helix-turn-helix transcriptional regulator [Sphaerochaeta sp.]|nr:winged helix-turn-helix transcriptional regulator [Sphaerochaeta sp.]